MLGGFRMPIFKEDSMIDKNISTKELVEELIQRDGVEETIAEPYQDVVVTVSGPARVLVITD